MAVSKDGNWPSSDQATLDTEWVQKLRDKLKAKGPTELHPAVRQFKLLIETDPEVNMFFYQMFNPGPDFPLFTTDPTGAPQVQSWQEMIELLDIMMTTAPEYNSLGLVGHGCPIYAVLNWSCMATPGGFAAFLNDKVNKQLKYVLNQWGVYLTSEESTYVLNDGPNGWFSKDALQDMGGNFAETFICDPSAQHYGFTSWDNFFTRQFRPGVRPVADPIDENIIVNACESAPYRLQRNIEFQSTLWVKGQNYSVQYMLNNDPLALQFNGGTVYQAYLSGFSYHRWHSPVDGKITKTVNVDGTYYSNILLRSDPSRFGSQGYITNVAARALIFIEADNPSIGLMCFVAVGMDEVSSNEITVYEGQHVKKGQQLGMFHFGGSTYCLVFRPGVELKFYIDDHNLGFHATNINLSAKLARVLPSPKGKGKEENKTLKHVLE